MVPAMPGLIQKKQSYDYSYDNLNHLSLANYTTTGNIGKFNEQVSYDVMGNITALKRTSTTVAGQYLNNFTYDYTSLGVGNKLWGVADAGTAAQAGSYQYDVNGNATLDTRNQITGISYNLLNLPQTVSRTPGNLTYIYDAQGTKLEKVSGGITRDYIGGIEYNNGAIEFIATEEGRAVPTGSTYGYEYYLKDHLGNTRAAVKQDGSIALVQDYYAFGLDMNPGNAFASTPPNQYKYNGKEKQETGYYDYGWRQYDPLIGRWTHIDGKAEAFESLSPYVYAVNDPVNAVDPDGNLIIFVNGFVPDQWLHQDNRKLIDANMGNTHYTGVRLVPNKSYSPYPGDRNFHSGSSSYLGQSFDYWGGVDDAFEKGYNDNHALYVNASSQNDSEAGDRFAEGETAGNNLISQLDAGKISLSDGESIKIVSHSQGGAFAAGLSTVLSKSKKYASVLQQVVYLEPHQPADFNHPASVDATQISSPNDRVASIWNFLGFLKGKTSYSKINGVKHLIPNNTHKGDATGGHSVESNLDEMVAYFRSLGIPVTIK